MLGPDQPTIACGLREAATNTIRILGPLKDGLFGGAIESLIHVLMNLITGFHNHGRASLPGFYEETRFVDEEERAELARFPIGDPFRLETIGAPAIWGEDEFTHVERD